MTVRVLDYRGDGAYYLCDPAHELDGLRDGPPGTVLRGPEDRAIADAVRRLLAVPLDDGRRAVDLVVAAPKPVSVLMATEPPRVARRVVALHERATAAAVGYLLDEWAPSGLAVAFAHGINRHGDPHLHTHVLVGARDTTGRPIAVRSLRWRARAADALYLAALRHGMPAAAGRAAWVGRSAATLVEGVDVGVVAAMSAARGPRGVVEPGGPKRHPTVDEVRARWEASLAAAARIGTLAPRVADPVAIDEHRFAVELGTDRVRRDDVVRAWATACPRGAPTGDVLRAAALVAPGLDPGDWVSAAIVRDDPGVGVLGPRPRDPSVLASWRGARAALERYLSEGHRARHVHDERGASAATRLALARLDAELAGLRRARPTGRALARDGRALS